jgi:copper chaperone CopZ
MSTTTLQVNGMTCGACVRHVNQALNAIGGVTAVDVDLASGLVRVEGNADNSAMIAALDEAGYPAQLASEASSAAAPSKGCGSGCGCR